MLQHCHISGCDHTAFSGSQSAEFRVKSGVNYDFDSGPPGSPLSGLRIEIINSGVDSDVVPPPE